MERIQPRHILRSDMDDRAVFCDGVNFSVINFCICYIRICDVECIFTLQINSIAEMRKFRFRQL